MAERLYSTRDAAVMLNISQATLRDWGRRSDIHTSNDLTDRRVKGWTLGELQRIAKLKGKTLGKPPVEPEPSRRMRELEHRVEVLEALEARVARLEAHLVAFV